MYINNHTYKEIIDELNSKGYRTKRNNKFSKSSLYGILKNGEKYSGVYIFNRLASKDLLGKRASSRTKSDENIIKIPGGMPQIISKETYIKSNEMLKKRKKSPGALKSKELYLLQGLINCGVCGAHYEGNRRKRNKNLKYVSYRCGNRHFKYDCDNTEIRKEMLERFILSELENRILTNNTIDHLLNKVNKYIGEKEKDSGLELKLMNDRLSKINEQINHIVDAIANGYDQSEFLDKMDSLKSEKRGLITNIAKIKASTDVTKINRSQLEELFSKFKEFVIKRDLPQCKRLIQDYVKDVVVYKDHIEVTFNVASLVLDDFNEYMVSKIIRNKLYEEYSGDLWYKKSNL